MNETNYDKNTTCGQVQSTCKANGDTVCAPQNNIYYVSFSNSHWLITKYDANDDYPLLISSNICHDLQSALNLVKSKCSDEIRTKNVEISMCNIKIKVLHKSIADAEAFVKQEEEKENKKKFAEAFSITIWSSKVYHFPWVPPKLVEVSILYRNSGTIDLCSGIATFEIPENDKADGRWSVKFGGLPWYLSFDQVISWCALPFSEPFEPINLHDLNR